MRKSRSILALVTVLLLSLSTPLAAAPRTPDDDQPVIKRVLRLTKLVVRSLSDMLSPPRP